MVFDLLLARSNATRDVKRELSCMSQRLDAQCREMSNLRIEVVELQARLHERASDCSQAVRNVGRCVHLGRADMVCIKSPLEGGRCEGVYLRDASDWLCPMTGADWA